MSATYDVLVTGSTGAIGHTVAMGLREAGHRVRGLDLRPTPGLQDMVIGSIADPDVVRRAMQGVNRLVHLAAWPDQADFMERLLEPNIIGLHHVLSIAAELKVPRIVLASSMQVVWGAWKQTQPVGTDVVNPMNEYALTKVWAETYGRMIARKHGLEVVAARIAWFCRYSDDAHLGDAKQHMRAIYISRGDTVRFFLAAIEVPKIDTEDGFACVYAAGRGYNGRQPFDPEPARRLLGYEPRDEWPADAPRDLHRPEWARQLRRWFKLTR